MNYEKMKLSELRNLAEEHEIPTNSTKDEIIKQLKLVEQEKFIKQTTCEKFGKEYLVGVDIKDQRKLVTIGRYVENKEMKRANMFSSDRVYFLSTFKYLG
jgi:phosphoribosylformimino-5-aminoimidazole carboxamide ribonucleotide (ProFAR) isomerase